MAYLVLGIGLVLLVHFGSRAFMRANPALLAALAKRGGGLLSLLAAVLLLMRGRINLALSFGGLALWLFSGRPLSNPSSNEPGGQSKARSATLEMVLDHASGAMHGTVLDGPYSGRQLDDLGRGECLALQVHCASVDPDGARLLEAYLDRRFPDWRQADTEDTAARPRGATMTIAEAYDVLGLPMGAAPEQITRAHRELMKRLHPDHGGSTYLAARVNAAKDLLLHSQR
jgi:hypothetical protein